jgi:hypothetical protein
MGIDVQDKIDCELNEFHEFSILGLERTYGL